MEEADHEALMDYLEECYLELLMEGYNGET